MNPFDRLISSFSSRDLKPRVRQVIAFGVSLSAAAIVGGAVFLSAMHERNIEGTAAFPLAAGAFNVQLDPLDAGLLRPFPRITVEFIASDGQRFRTEAEVISVAPQLGLAVIRAEHAPLDMAAEGRIRVKLILYEKPYWQFLWEGAGGTDEGR